VLKPKTKTEILKELKILIKRADYLPNSEIKRWTLIVDYLNLDELRDTYDHFSQTEKEQKEYKLKLIYKSKLGPQFIEKIHEISKDYKKMANQEEERFLRETSENPEDVLKKIQQD
jgi:hypothetical protein